jgi:single-stranded DNA-specific DHH superfamily exonuclease
MESLIAKVKDDISRAQKPLFLFDDDPDGLTSFLLLYRWAKKGKGVVIKSSPELNDTFLRKVDEYLPDLLVILDKPLVSQSFLDQVYMRSIPVIWIDHHPVQERKHVTYLNPRNFNDEDNRPTSYWAWRIVEENVWIAAVGMVGDWHLLEDVRDSLKKKYPDLLPDEVKTPPEALFTTKIGRLVKVFAFNLKGKITEVNASIKILTRIDDPYEILDQQTPRGKFLYRKYEKINILYEEILSSINPGDQPIIYYTYKDNKTSFTGELANELLYRFPEKVTIIAREKGGEMKCSIRSGKVILPSRLKKALEGLEGYGGGHDLACGACIKKKHFKEFFTRFNTLILQK